MLAQILFTVDSDPLLFAACAAVGVSDGMFWGSLPLVSNRVFGLRNSGGIYGMLVCFGLYPIATLQYSSTTPYQVSYHIQHLSFESDNRILP